MRITNVAPWTVAFPTTAFKPRSFDEHLAIMVLSEVELAVQVDGLIYELTHLGKAVRRRVMAGEHVCISRVEQPPKPGAFAYSA